MPSANRLMVVNFGANKAGLSTVGYTLYTVAGASYQSRVTSGVFEVGSNTGIYAVNAPIEQGFEGVVLWDTGDASIKYASQESFSQLNSIQDQTDQIRLIWNSLRNQGEFFAKVMDKIGLLEKNVGVQLPDMKEAINQAVGGIKFPEQKEIKIPEFPSIPDNSEKFSKLESMVIDLKNSLKDSGESKLNLSRIEKMVNGISSEIKTLPKSMPVIPEYSGQFKNLQSMIGGFIGSMTDSIKKESSNNTGVLIAELKKISAAFSKMDDLMVKINSFNEKLNNVDSNSKEISEAKKSIQSEIMRLNVLFNMLAQNSNKPSNEMTYLFGHRVKNG